MIPADWVPHYRAADGELVGYLSGTDPVRPLTVFGYPLGAPTSRAQAIARLESDGLRCLAERWVLRSETGEAVGVRILSVFADRVELVRADFGYYEVSSERYTLPIPTGDRLEPYRGSEQRRDGGG